MIFNEKWGNGIAFCLDPRASVKTGEKFRAEPFELLGRNLLHIFKITS